MRFDLKILGRLLCVLLMFTSVLSHEKASAQFTYFNVGAGYGLMPIETTSSAFGLTELAVHHQFRVNAGAMYRPIRNLGIGVDLSIPMFQSNNFSFAGAQSIGGNFNGWELSIFGAEARYKPNDIDYRLQQNLAFSVFGRIFLTREMLLYVDIKYTNSTMDEFFELRRSAIPADLYSNGDLRYPAVGALNINHEERRNLHMPGLAVGYSQPLGDFLVFDAQIGADMIFFGSGGGFLYPVDFDYDISSSITSVAFLRSKAQGTKVIVSLKTGLSYFF